MKIGLIDVDGHNFPSIPLMKLSAWHKAQGDSVEWYQPLFSGHMDKVYMSKVFSFTPDYEYFIDADEVVKGGSGYAITTGDQETYDKSKDKDLPPEIEHIYPDYSIYPQYSNTAYGFLTRGCPRKCSFCHVKDKEGTKSYKVADLSEFWRGQKRIEICDPNILACKDREELFNQIISSGASINFNQGLDIRLTDECIAEMINHIKVSSVHFAWDRFEDQEIIEPKFKTFRDHSYINERKLIVYVLCGYKERVVTDEDLYRIYWLRDNGFTPYVMLYNKNDLPSGSDLRKLQRWVNNRFVFRSVEYFDNYRS